MNPKISQLGPVMQLAFVPEDFEKTIDFWVETMGAGPFYVVERTRGEWGKHRGEPTDPVLTVALGHWGDMQIEIIRQENEAPSPYREWRQAGGEGLHHVCITVDDLAHARRVCDEAGAELLLHAGGTGAEWVYVDTGGGPGTIVEIIQHSEQTAGLMAMIRDAARDWDGSDPVRRIGIPASPE